MRSPWPAWALLAAPVCRAADIYDEAVQHAGAPPDDLKRDPLDHPAEILRLTGIKPGMQVGDFMASDGYYSELLSYIVGPKGHVLLINNPSFDCWANNAWEGRLAQNRLPNVEHKTIDLNHIEIADDSLDALLVVKVYHDLYWVDKKQKQLADGGYQGGAGQDRQNAQAPRHSARRRSFIEAGGRQLTGRLAASDRGVLH